MQEFEYSYFDVRRHGELQPIECRFESKLTTILTPHLYIKKKKSEEIFIAFSNPDDYGDFLVLPLIMFSLEPLLLGGGEDFASLVDANSPSQVYEEDTYDDGSIAKYLQETAIQTTINRSFLHELYTLRKPSSCKSILALDVFSTGNLQQLTFSPVIGGSINHSQYSLDAIRVVGDDDMIFKGYSFQLNHLTDGHVSKMRCSNQLMRKIYSKNNLFQ